MPSKTRANISTISPQYYPQPTTTNSPFSTTAPSPQTPRTHNRSALPVISGPQPAAYTTTSLHSLPEDVFLRELRMVLAGSPETEHASLDTTGNFVLFGGSLRQRNQFSALQSCGALVHSIRSRVTSNDFSVTTPSFLQQSLQLAIETQLNAYTQSLAECSSNGELEALCRKAHPRLTLLRDLLFIQEGVSRSKGGELVTKLQPLLHHHGSPSFSAFCQSLYAEATAPLLRLTRQWLCHGHVTDPFHEFYILCFPEKDLWRGAFVFRPDMWPTSLPLGLGQRILRIGKNLNFLRACSSAEFEFAPSLIQSLEQTLLEELDPIVDEALCVTDTAVMDSLRSQHDLLEVFDAIRFIFLHASGELFARLHEEGVYESIFSSNQPGNVRDNARIREAEDRVRGILRESKLGPISTDLSDRVNIIGIKSSEDQPLNDTFSLNLQLSLPLNIILDAEAQAVYAQLCSFLWRVRRCGELLKRAWRDAFEFDRQTMDLRQGPGEELRALRQLTARLYQNLAHISRGIEAYLMTEVVHSATHSFQQKVESCDSVDQLLQVHATHLDVLRIGALFNHPQLLQTVEALLGLGVGFAETMRTLVEAQRATQGGVTLKSEYIHSVMNSLVTAEATVDRHAGFLLEQIESQPQELDFVQSLGARIDFNRRFLRAVRK